MGILRRSVVLLLNVALGLLLVLFGAGAVAYLTVLSPSFAKDSIEASGLYEDFGADTLRVLSAGAGLTLAYLEPVFERVLTPELIRSNTEAVIDGFGSWLKGETGLPDFRIDTAGIRSNLDLALVDHLDQRLATLPPCPAGTDYSLYSPFTAGCRPPGGLDRAALLAWTAEFTSQMPLLGRDQLAGSDLPHGPSYPGWDAIPRRYWWGRFSLILFAALLVSSAGVVLSVTADRPKVLRRIGHLGVGSALALFIGAAVIGILGHGDRFYGLTASNSQEEAFAQDVVHPVFSVVLQGVAIRLAVFGALFALIAAICYLTAHRLNRRRPTPPLQVLGPVTRDRRPAPPSAH